MEDYLDDLVTQSKRRVDHIAHLWVVFKRCCFYKIWVSPNKCIFCVVTRRLLGFIISKYGIMVNPFRVEVIVQLPPLKNIRQLQMILQGKENFLWIFIANYYIDITKGFMCLLCGMISLKNHLKPWKKPLWQPHYWVMWDSPCWAISYHIHS